MGSTLLKTGERIDGIFKQATSAGAVIEVGGQTITIPLGKLQAIYFGAVPARQPVVGPGPVDDAMDALKALRSVTDSGISYREYAPRVLDAKIRIDRYLSSPTKDPARNAIGLGMRFYQLASEAWEMGVLAVDVGKVIVGDPSLAACTALKKVAPSIESRNAMPAEEKLKDPVLVGMYLGQHPTVLWACASEQVAEAERLLRQSPPTPVSATANPTLEQLAANSEAARASPAAAAGLASVGHAQSQQELADLVQKGLASRCAVVTAPPGAEVYVDGNKAGVSPVAFVLLKQGDTPRKVTIKMTGYKTVEKAVVPDGKTIPIGLTLEKQ
jgi:hypothetical protein